MSGPTPTHPPRLRWLLDVMAPVAAAAGLFGVLEGAAVASGESAEIVLWSAVLEGLFAIYLAVPIALLWLLALRVVPRLRGLADAALRSASLAVGLGSALSMPLAAWTTPWAALPLALLAAVGGFLLLRRLPSPPRLAAPVLVVIAALAPVVMSRLESDPTAMEYRLGATPAAAPAADAPNILLISIDTLRDDRVGAQRDGVDLTPNLDALAAEGVRLPCTTPSNQTGPSHISLLTGRDVMDHGAFLNGMHQPRALPTVAARLAQDGWRTGSVVANSNLVARNGFARGFEVFDDSIAAFYGSAAAFARLRIVSSRLPQIIRRRAIAMPLLAYMFVLGDAKGYRDPQGDQVAAKAERMLTLLGGGERPFFAFVHFLDPHAPYNAGGDFRGRLLPTEDDPLPEMKTGFDFHQVLRGIPAQFAAGDPQAEAYLHAMELRYDEEVMFVDHCTQRVIDAARAASGERPLWIVVTSDHGEHFMEHDLMEHANSLYEELLQAPLILHGAGLLAAPERPSRTEEIPRFLVRAATGDVEWPGLVEEARGPLRLQLWNQFLVVRDGNFKLHLTADRPFGEYRPVALYDLSSDPGEEHDILAEHFERVDALVAELDRIRAALPEHSGEQPKLDAFAEAALAELGYVH